MINREEILSSVPIKSFMEGKGFMFEKRGKEWFCKCPFHNDNSPSFRVNEEKKVWMCDPCNVGGSIIDLMAKIENLSVGDVLRRFDNHPTPTQMPVNPSQKPKIAKIYDYHNQIGELVYQVVRCEPKTFRQRRLDTKGNWVWDMEGINRVLYRLPEIIPSEWVFITEGEKDADNLVELGFKATCNVGGAGKWMKGYNDFLINKEIVICPDNDEVGMKHAKDIMESLAGKVKTLQVLQIPKEFKDISEYISVFPIGERKNEVMNLVMKTPKLDRGIDLPILGFSQMEKEYISITANSKSSTLDLASWIPSFRQCLRPIMPGAVVAFLADTGTGKTAILQNVAVHAAPLDVLFFEMELTAADLFERFMQIYTKNSGDLIWNEYEKGNTVPWNHDLVKHIHVCPLPSLDVDRIEKLILQSELRIGRKPAVVIIDYVQLIKGGGKSRYEKTSDVMEGLRRVAVSTNTIMIISSQVHRKEGDGNTDEIGLHDAKDSGSVEASSSIQIGAWRSKDDPEKTLLMRVNKSTKSRKNFTVHCNFHGETMTITEKRK